MKIKVCGNKLNIAEVLALQPDFMGFILYEKSARYISIENFGVLFKNDFGKTKRVLVTVNLDLQEVKRILKLYPFEAIQLHGAETPEYCAELKQGFPKIEIIKAFQVSALKIPDISAYEVADYFLFDTASSKYGGSGEVFDWNLLKKINSSKSYFLAGGLNPGNIESALAISDKNLYALDLNSGFEESPGLKSIEDLSKVFNRIRL